MNDKISPEMLDIIRDMVNEAVANREAADMLERFANGDVRCETCIYFIEGNDGGFFRCMYNPPRVIARGENPMTLLPDTYPDGFCSKWTKKV